MIPMEVILHHIRVKVLVGEPEERVRVHIFYHNLNLSHILRVSFCCCCFGFYNKANFLLREVWKTLLPTFLGNDSDIKFEIGSLKEERFMC